MPWCRSVSILLAASLLTFAVSACADEKPRGKIVILDVTEKADKRVFVFDVDYALPKAGGSLKEALDPPAGKAKQSPASLLQLVHKSAATASSRWVSRKGDRAFVFTFRPESYLLDLTVNEKTRETQLTSDIATLFRAVAVPPKVAKNLTDETALSRDTLYLGEVRSTLTVHAGPSQAQELLNGLGMLEGGSGDKPKSGKNLPTAEIVLTTGPAEHWFLSTSVPLTRITEVKYVDSLGTFEPRDKPTRVLIGLNYLIGDVLSDNNRALKALAPGILLEASSKPFRSLGMGISYRLPAWTAFGLKFNLVAPFLGLLRTTSDSKDSSGSVKRDAHTVYKGAAGLSLNLDKAAGWLSGK